MESAHIVAEALEVQRALLLLVLPLSVLSVPQLNPTLTTLIGVELKEHIVGLPSGLGDNTAVLQHLKSKVLNLEAKRVSPTQHEEVKRLRS